MSTLDTLSPKFRCQSSSNTHAYSLAFEADDGLTYCLATAQFLDLVLGPNPARATDADAPPERVVMRFGDTEVVLLGSSLASLLDDLARGDLSALRSVPLRFKAVEKLRPHIVSIQVHRTSAET
jgi:hypothetical protein